MIHGALVHEGVLLGGACDSSLPKATIRAPWDDRIVGAAAEGDVRLLEGMFEAAARSDLPRTSVAIRRDALLAVADDLDRYAEEWADGLVRELAKPIAWARAEVARGAVTFRLAAARTVDHDAETPVDPGADPRNDYRLGIRLRPIGPIYAIVPWNWPINLAAHKIAPAIAAGCPIVVKVSPIAPLATLRLAAILNAHLPPGSISAWNGPDAELTRFDPVGRCAHLSFTGSGRVGWNLRLAYPDLPMTLELGAASPVIVDQGSDLDRAAERIVWGGYGFAGQVCISVQHVLAHHDVAAELGERILARLPNVLPPDDPAALLSCLISPTAATRVHSLATGTLLAGGPPSGNRLAPILVEDADDGPLDGIEAFGPIVRLRAVADLERAIALVNGLPGIIQAGYFGETPERFLRDVRTGGAVIGDVPTVRFDALPYGGLGESGWGREGVEETLRAFVRPLATIRAEK